MICCRQRSVLLGDVFCLWNVTDEIMIGEGKEMGGNEGIERRVASGKNKRSWLLLLFFSPVKREKRERKEREMGGSPNTISCQ